MEPSLAKEGRGGSKKQHSRAVTSFPFMVKGKAWLGIKDPPVGEEQVEMHAWKMTAGRFDIGSLDTYKEACEKFGK